MWRYVMDCDRNACHNRLYLQPSVSHVDEWWSSPCYLSRAGPQNICMQVPIWDVCPFFLFFFFFLQILLRKGLDNDEDKRPLMPKEYEMQVPRKDASTNALDAGPFSALPMQPNLSGRWLNRRGKSIVHPQPQIEGQRVWRKAAPVVHTRKYRFIFYYHDERLICKLQDCPGTDLRYWCVFFSFFFRWLMHVVPAP